MWPNSDGIQLYLTEIDSYIYICVERYVKIQINPFLYGLLFVPIMFICIYIYIKRQEQKDCNNMVFLSHHAKPWGIDFYSSCPN